MNTKRILSGVQPTGALHLGNYFGAVKQHLELQETHECFLFIANYHALTSIHDRERLQIYTRDAATTYLALGLDPDKTEFWRQSDVPEVVELTWLLLTVTGVGLLERAHSYKDKVAKGTRPSAALFTYPVLMASDILAFKPALVPVGKDQQQHVEFAQDIAASFNHTYGQDVFDRPEPLFSETPRVPGTEWERDADGTFQRDSSGNRIPQKMSKSYANTIEIFAEGKQLQKRVGNITTDSVPLEDPMDPDDCLVFTLASLFMNREELHELDGSYRAGGFGYGRAKEKLATCIDKTFAPFRDRRRQLEQQPDFVEDILRTGAERARVVVRETLDEARAATGLT